MIEIEKDSCIVFSFFAVEYCCSLCAISILFMIIQKQGRSPTQYRLQITITFQSIGTIDINQGTENGKEIEATYIKRLMKSLNRLLSLC